MQNSCSPTTLPECLLASEYDAFPRSVALWWTGRFAPKLVRQFVVGSGGMFFHAPSIAHPPARQANQLP